MSQTNTFLSKYCERGNKLDKAFISWVTCRPNKSHTRDIMTAEWEGVGGTSSVLPLIRHSAFFCDNVSIQE